MAYYLENWVAAWCASMRFGEMHVGVVGCGGIKCGIVFQSAIWCVDVLCGMEYSGVGLGGMWRGVVWC